MPTARLINPQNRNVAIAGGVVLLHLLVLWAMQTGLLRRAVETVIPVEIISDIMTPPEVLPPPPPRVRPTPKPQTIAEKVTSPPPIPVAAPEPSPPAPAAPTGTAAPQAAPAAIAAPVGPSAGPAKIELPSSDADYLNNPAPQYPAISRRLGEQGKVVVRVLIGADGQPQQAELRQSSGFDRLDKLALATVMKWRYVPGKRGGTAETMWFNVPLNFRLEQ